MKVFNIQDKTKVEIIEHNIFDKNLDIFRMKNNTVFTKLNYPFINCLERNTFIRVCKQNGKRAKQT